MAAIRGIIEAGLPEQRAKSEEIAGERGFGVIAVIDLKRSVSRVKTLEVEKIPHGKVAVYDSKRVQICDTVNDLEHPSPDILDPPLVVIRHEGLHEGSLELGENDGAFFRPSQQMYDEGETLALQQVADLLFVGCGLFEMLFGAQCDEG